MFSRSIAIFQQRAASKGTGPVVRAVVPSMQIYNVQADPSAGSLTRLTSENRGFRISVVPQLGAPNTDPQDETPQFDASRRALSTFTPKESAAMLAVLEGKLPQFAVESEFRSLTFAPNTNATTNNSFQLTGTLVRSNLEKIPVNVAFERANLASLRVFLESSIDEGFGFNQFFNPPQKLVIRKYDQEQRVLKRQQESEERRELRDRQRSDTNNNSNKNNGNNQRKSNTNNNNNNNTKNNNININNSNRNRDRNRNRGQQQQKRAEIDN